jgi:hypothetical protein
MDAAELAKDDVVAILRYVAKGPVAVSRQIVQNTLERFDAKRAEEIMRSFGADFFEQGLITGEARGEARGRAQGKAEAQANTLTRLLEKRFGPLPRYLRERVASADSTSVEAWLDHVMDAPDLQSVFRI